MLVTELPIAMTERFVQYWNADAFMLAIPRVAFSPIVIASNLLQLEKAHTPTLLTLAGMRRFIIPKKL